MMSESVSAGGAMNPDPLFGVFLHWLGGLSSASFYVPYKRIRGWSWEIFWITGGLFSWLAAPWLFASIQTPHLLQVLGADVGTRRADVRLDDALPGSVVGDGGGTRLDHRDWDDRPPLVPWS